MPSEKILSMLPLRPAVICFGQVTRDEINNVLTEAGISLTPPSKTPFATGIRRRRRRKSKPSIASKLNDNTPTDASPSPPSSLSSSSSSSSSCTSSSSPSSSLSLSPPPSIAPQAPPQLLSNESKSTSITTPLKQNTNAVTAPDKCTALSTQTESSASNTAPPITMEGKVNNVSSMTTTTITSTPAPAPASVPVKAPTSWAALLKPTGEKAKSSVASTLSKSRPSVPGNTSSATSSPKKFTGLADIIYHYEPTYMVPLLEPRGMINNVNTCFMNVILQPLSHCPPFYNMIKSISQHVVHSFKSQTPLLDSLIEFVNEFRPQNQNGEYGEPFVPEYVYDALRGQKRFDSLRGRQEDAEEFLCFLLDGLHEEMIGVVKIQLEKREEEEKKRQAGNEGGSWLEVGPKNKTATLQTTIYEDSPIKKLFGGTGRSVLRCPGAKDSVTVEPYQSLPLDIQPESVHSIEDAIRNMTLPETMHDYMSPKGVRVDATKQVYLENLPPVLILHVKRFVFDNVGGVQKLRKQVQYSSKMTIQQDWMTQPSLPVTYQLFGVVYHHGNSAGGGHYTCDIKRQNGEWLHIDDTTITPVKEEDVLVSEQNTQTSERKQADQTPYILFYMRC